MQTYLILSGRLRKELVNSCLQISPIRNLPLKERFSWLLVRIPVAKLRLATLIFVIVGGGPASLNALTQKNVRLTVTAVGDVRITGRLARSQLDQIRKIQSACEEV